MIKILHFMDYEGFHGGLYLFLNNLELIMKPLGYTFYYIAREKAPFKVKDKRFDVVVATEINLEEYVKSIAPDIIHFHDWILYEQMEWCVNNYKTIRTFHDNYSFCKYGFYKDGNVCTNCNFEKCLIYGCITEEEYEMRKKYIELQQEMDVITCLSRSMLNKCIQFGFEKNKVFKIPPLLEKIPQTPICERRIKNIIYAGRVVESKGVEYLIESLGELKDLEWHLYVAGTGEKIYVKSLIRKCMNEGFKGRVSFLGHLEHERLINLLRMADIFVFTSIAPEGYGYTGAEAMQLGVPIIAFDVEGHEEWLINGYNGFVIPTKNSAVMAQYMRKLLSDPCLLRGIKVNALRYSDEMIDIVSQKEKMEEIYNLLL